MRPTTRLIAGFGLPFDPVTQTGPVELTPDDHYRAEHWPELHLPTLSLSTEAFIDRRGTFGDGDLRGAGNRFGDQSSLFGVDVDPDLRKSLVRHISWLFSANSFVDSPIVNIAVP
jgi:hypothetical protein